MPVLSVWLMKHRSVQSRAKETFFDRILPVFGRSWSARRSGSAGSWCRRTWSRARVLLWLVGSQVGTELFPQVDSGQFVLRFRTPAGFGLRADAEVRASRSSR